MIPNAKMAIVFHPRSQLLRSQLSGALQKSNHKCRPPHATRFFVACRPMPHAAIETRRKKKEKNEEKVVVDAAPLTLNFQDTTHRDPCMHHATYARQYPCTHLIFNKDLHLSHQHSTTPPPSPTRQKSPRQLHHRSPLWYTTNSSDSSTPQASKLAR